MAADSSGRSSIWVRPLDALEAHPLAGTVGAGRPFWSPDSRFLAYIQDGKLRKVPVSGRTAGHAGRHAGRLRRHLGRENTILFDGAGTDSIRGVPASGGTMRGVTRFDRQANEGQHGWPTSCPTVATSSTSATGRAEPNRGTIKVGTLGSDRVKKLGETDGRVEYAPGYLVFTREGTLMAQRFDPRALATSGDPVPIGENITMGGAAGYFSTSAAGVLAYRSQRGSRGQPADLVRSRG